MSDPAHVNTLQNQEEPEVDYQETPQNDPYRTLPKSSMNLAQCKNDYFISRENKENYFTEKFWQSYDKEGYSIHYGKYKYNDELSPLAFIRRNVVTGIIQSMDSTIAHKNLFGVFKLLGVWSSRRPTLSCSLLDLRSGRQPSRDWCV